MSWVVGRGRGCGLWVWVWVNVVGKKSMEKNDKKKTTTIINKKIYCKIFMKLKSPTL